MLSKKFYHIICENAILFQRESNQVEIHRTLPFRTENGHKAVETERMAEKRGAVFMVQFRNCEIIYTLIRFEFGAPFHQLGQSDLTR